MTARDWLDAVRAHGLRPSVSRYGVRLRYAEWDAMPEALRLFAQRHERTILDTLRLETEPTPAVASEPRPAHPTFHGRPITEDDVRECLDAVGGDALARYDSGALPQDEAYAMTREWLGILERMAARYSRHDVVIGRPSLSRVPWPF